jgi:hypothetical protein
MGARLGHVAAAALISALAREAHAMHMANLVPPDRLVLGPSLAYGSIVGAGDHPMYGLDFTYGREIFWGTLGTRMLDDERPKLMPYAEVGIWLVLNVGAGVTFLANDPQRRRAAPHLFLGLPIPFARRDQGDAGVWLVEPYYRPLWWEGNTLHEVGLLLKVVVWSGGEDPPPRRPAPAPRTAPFGEPPLVDRPAKAVP